MGSLHFAQPAFRNISNKSKHLGLFSSSRFKVFQQHCDHVNNVNVHSGMMIHTGVSKSVRHLSTPRISLRRCQTSSVSRALICSRHIVQNEKLLPILDGQLELCKAKYLCFINTLQHKHSFSTSCAMLATRKTKKRRQELEVLPFEVDFGNITQDILVYTNEGQTRFFLLVSLFGVIQFGFWAYLAHFAYTTLRDAPVKEEEDVETLPFWRKINLGGNKYRFGTAVLCFTVGYVLLYASIFYPMRAIKHLTLLRGGRMAKITTYAPFGTYRSFKAKVEHIQSMQSRAEMKAQISLKIKNRRMFYLLDSNGKFLNTQVFDFIVGLKRQW